MIKTGTISPTSRLQTILQLARKVILDERVVVALVGIFYLLTIRLGHRWGDDFSMYIHHAKNIVLGIDYQDTGYLFHPITAVIGPRFYPPVFPLLLAPVYAVFGLNLTAMKAVSVLFFLLFLLVFHQAIKRDLSPAARAAALAVIGFNPAIWDLKDDIMSDIPFLFFVYLSLHLVERAYQPDKKRSSRSLMAVAAGMLTYLSFGTRTMGAVIVPVLFFFDLVRAKRPTLFPWIASAVFGLGWLLQNMVIRGSDDYMAQVDFIPRTYLYNLHNYFDALLSIWSNGYTNLLQYALFAVLLALAGTGFLVRIKSRITPFEIFAILYIGLIIVWRANQKVRFLLPLIPLFVFYILLAVQAGVNLRYVNSRRLISFALGLFVLTVMGSYLGKYSQTSFAPFNSGVEKPESVQLFEYIRRNTQPEDVFLFVKPRALALYTGHPAAGYSELENERYNLNFAAEMGVKYVVVGPGDDYLRQLVEHHPGQFELVFRNPDFEVHRFLGP